jgi:hypothetical protein
MPSVQITSTETAGADGHNWTLFNPFTDPLKLVVYFTLFFRHCLDAQRRPVINVPTPRFVRMTSTRVTL